jgi:hypothetical protein
MHARRSCRARRRPTQAHRRHARCHPTQAHRRHARCHPTQARRRHGVGCAFNLPDSAALERGAIAQGGMCNGGGPAGSGTRQVGEDLSAAADGDASAAAVIISAATTGAPTGAPVPADGDGSGAHATTAAATGGGTATAQSTRTPGGQQVNQIRPHLRVPASELYRPEAPNVPIRASVTRMSYCDAARSPPRSVYARVLLRAQVGKRGLSGRADAPCLPHLQHSMTRRLSGEGRGRRPAIKPRLRGSASGVSEATTSWRTVVTPSVA